jgi:hypothetical protein
VQAAKKTGVDFFHTTVVAEFLQTMKVGQYDGFWLSGDWRQRRLEQLLSDCLRYLASYGLVSVMRVAAGALVSFTSV